VVNKKIKAKDLIGNEFFGKIVKSIWVAKNNSSN
jgi:hypothetical protein